MQGRFLKWHVETENTYRYLSHKWMLDRILDLVIVGGMGSVEQASAKSYEKQFGDVKNEILDLVNPYREQIRKERAKQRKADAKREKYLGELAKNSMKGFKSLKDIKKTLGKLGKTINEMER